MKNQVDLDRSYGADMVKEMKKLQMKTDGTPLGRVLSLTGDFMEIITKNGWEDSFVGAKAGNLKSSSCSKQCAHTSFVRR